MNPAIQLMSPERLQECLRVGRSVGSMLICSARLGERALHASSAGGRRYWRRQSRIQEAKAFQLLDRRGRRRPKVRGGLAASDFLLLSGVHLFVPWMYNQRRAA